MGESADGVNDSGDLVLIGEGVRFSECGQNKINFGSAGVGNFISLC